MKSMTTLINKNVLLLAFLTPCLSVAAVDPAADLESIRSLLVAQQAEIDSMKQTIERQQTELES
jgi:hypothetical protein